MKTVDLPLALAILTACTPRLLCAAELQSPTLQEWHAYIRAADSGMQMRLDGRRPFLWADEAPGRRSRLLRGEILVSPASGCGTGSAPHALIHDWMGAVFIPHATVESFLSVANDYDRYKEIYQPVVVDSKVLASSGQDRSYLMILQRHVLFVTAAVEGRYQTRDFPVDARHGYSITATTRMQEIEDYGRGDAHLLPPDQGDGFVWRLHSIVRYQERDGGVYVEMEAIALTRDIPASLRWLVQPVINHLSIDSLATSLRETRDAVNSFALRRAAAGAGPAGRP